MNSHTHKPLLSRRRFSSGILMALAVLVLAVSCPLKRMLQSDFHTLSSALKANRPANSKVYANYLASISCCGLKKKIVTISTTLKSSETASAFFLAANDMASGFAIPYFLSGTTPKYDTVNDFPSSSLPLFLQHRRLLI